MVQQVKRKRRSVSGIIIFDKPYGFSSNGALQKVRWLLNADKGGHTGSLDPLATGVLPLCFGEATKFSRYLLDADKVYEATMQLGVTTNTADAEGEVLETKEVNVSAADIEAVLPQFRGVIEQVPPMFSALKKDGQPLPFAEVEVEMYNPDKKYDVPSDVFITQIVKTDANGVFSYAVPKAGWWGFAALVDGEKMKGADGKDVDVELGGLIWIKAVDMKERKK